MHSFSHWVDLSVSTVISLRQCLTHFVQPSIPPQVCLFISRPPGNPCLRDDAGNVVGQILWEALAKENNKRICLGGLGDVSDNWEGEKMWGISF
jgi:hypothetical protein